MAKRKTETILMYGKGRLAFVCFVVCFVLAAVGCRLFYLHVVRSDASIAEAEKARKRTEIISSKRGDITDAKRNLLATSSPVITIGVDPKTFKYQIGKDNEIPLKQIQKMSVSEMRAYKPSQQTRERLERVAQLLGMPYAELYEKCVAESSWQKLAVIDNEALFQQIRDCKIKAIYGNRKYTRKYPCETLLAHVIGFVNKEFKPVMGIEQQFDYYLTGQDGWKETERDGKRMELTQFRTRTVEPTDGLNVELSIDLFIQQIVQQQMGAIVATYRPETAAIIVSEPSTGYVLAMASYPTFNPNKFNKYDTGNFLNFAISGQYEPGSTFKVVPVAAALNESLIGPDDKFDCTQTAMSYNGKMLRMPKDDHPLGKNATVRDIIKKSSNRGSALIGGRLGAQRLVDYAHKFGFGQKTDIGLIGEISGNVLPLAKWDSLTITRMPIGHAVAVTPLQIHCAMATIANQGVYMQPQLVKRIYDAKGQTVMNYAPKALRRVISPKVATLMEEMLAEVTTPTGTARRAAIKGFKVAGKTGTSQKFIKAKDLPPNADGTRRKRGEYSNKKHVASFTGFFPATRPRLVITVVVDTPKLKGVGYGGLVAAPAFREIGEQAAVYLGIQSDEEFEKTMAWKTLNYDGNL